MEVIHSGQSVTGSGEPLCWCGQILLLHSCKGGDPFSCASPISINSLGKEDLEREGGHDKCRESASRLVVFGFGPCERQQDTVWGACRGRTECRAPQTTERRKLTTNMPDWGRRAPDRLLSSQAMWPHWAVGSFFHSTSFPCHTERKRAADVWENRVGLPAREGFGDQTREWNPQEMWQRVSVLKSSNPAAL